MPVEERHYLGLYWEDRPANIAECVADAKCIVDALAAISPLFATWYGKGDTREAALANPLVTDEALLRAMRERQDGTAETEPLGFYLTAWNGGPPGESVVLDLTLGAHAGLANVLAPNSCVVQLPRSGQTFKELVSAETLRKMIRALAPMVRPDWGVVTTNVHQVSSALARGAGQPFAGWFTFLSKSRGAVASVDGAEIEDIGDVGTLIVTQEDVFSYDDLVAAAKVDATHERLARMGLLRATGDMTQAGASSLLFVTARRVVDALGPGLPARVYLTAVGQALEMSGAEAEKDVRIPIYFDDLIVGELDVPLVVDGCCLWFADLGTPIRFLEPLGTVVLVDAKEGKVFTWPLP